MTVDKIFWIDRVVGRRETSIRLVDFDMGIIIKLSVKPSAVGHVHQHKQHSRHGVTVVMAKMLTVILTIQPKRPNQFI